MNNANPTQAYTAETLAAAMRMTVTGLKELLRCPPHSLTIKDKNTEIPVETADRVLTAHRMRNEKVHTPQLKAALMTEDSNPSDTPAVGSKLAIKELSLPEAQEIESILGVSADFVTKLDAKVRDRELRLLALLGYKKERERQAVQDLGRTIAKIESVKGDEERLDNLKAELAENLLSDKDAILKDAFGIDLKQTFEDLVSVEQDRAEIDEWLAKNAENSLNGEDLREGELVDPFVITKARLSKLAKPSTSKLQEKFTRSAQQTSTAS